MKLRVAALALASCTVIAGAAHADNFIPGLYTVINYSGAYPDFKNNVPLGFSSPSFLDGVEADIGWRFNRFYSMEASYSYFTGSKNSPGSTSFTTQLQTASIDALGYLPFGPRSEWALYADVGGTGYFLNQSTPIVGVHSNRFGGRAGGGVQFQFNEDLGLRVGARYEFANLPAMKSATVFAIGLVWQR
jgi:opacity protein-like surface antigen